jgi:hypothetical protein
VHNTKGGVEGMQEQCQHVDEIQIGTMKVQLSPTGSASFYSYLGKKVPFYMSISHVGILPLNNKNCTDFHANSLPSRSTSEFPTVGARVACQGAASLRQCRPASTDAALSADSERVHARRDSCCMQ